MKINTVNNKEGQIKKLSFVDEFSNENDLELSINSLKINKKLSSELKKISFKNCGINDSMAPYLSDIFDAELFPKLTKIDLSNNNLTDNGFAELLVIQHQNREKYKENFREYPLDKEVILNGNKLKNPKKVMKDFLENIENNHEEDIEYWDFSSDSEEEAQKINESFWKDADPENEINPNPSPETVNQEIRETNLKKSSMVNSNNQNQI